VREAPGLIEGLRELPFLLARFVDPTYGDIFDQVFATAHAVSQGILQNVIPFFGPILVSIPTVLVAMTVGWPHAVGANVVLLVVNQLDAQVLSPIVFAHTVEIDPATILLAIFLGTVLFGLLGAVLAVPAAVMLRFFVRRTYLQSAWYRGISASEEAPS
jgi:predicted PurR-regulated permease PerM